MRYIKVIFLFTAFLFSTNHLNAQICIVLTSGSNDQKVCVNSAIVNIVYTLGTGVTATVSGLPSGVIGTYSPGSFIISGIPLVSGTFNYKITTSGTCTGTPEASGTITVYPLPVPTITGPASVCVGTIGNVYTTESGMTNYLWTVSVGGTITAGGGATDNSVTITWTTTGAKTVRVNYTNTNGCKTASPTVLNVTVNSLPVPTITGPTPICTGSTGNVYRTETGMSNYVWSVSAGGTITAGGGTGNNTVTVTWVTAGAKTVSVNYTNANGCTATSPTVFNVTVNSLPVPTISGPTPICVGTTGNVYTTESGMTNYLWTVSAGGTVTAGGGTSNNSVTVSWTTSGAKTVSVNYTNVNGCTAASPTVYNVTVNPLPVATASNNGPVCAGTALSLTGGPSGMQAYSWSGPNGFSNATMSPIVSPSATVAMAGTYSLIVVNSNGCSSIAATTTVAVNVSPMAVATNNGPVCAGSPLTLAGSPNGMSSYSWKGPNSFTSTLQNPTVSFTATSAMAGKYILTVLSSNGCQDTASTNVVVNALPAVTAANNGSVCSGSPLILTGGPDGMTTYAWTGPLSFSSSLQSPTVSLSSTTAMSGAYTLTVTDSHGCKSAAATSAIVNQSPVATAANNGPVCVGSQLALTGGPLGMTTYLWTGPNSFISSQMSPPVSPSATLAMAGVYTLKITNITGCQDTATTRAYVFAVPVSNPGLGGTECDLNFVLNAVPSVGIGTWTIVTGPGTAVFTPNANAASATVTVSAYGTYTFRWTETNGPCISSNVVTVNFYQQPLANAGIGGNECDLDFTLNAVPSIGVGTWTMTKGSGIATFLPNVNSPFATVQVSEYGTKEFTWIEINGICADTSAITVNFYEPPVANAGSGGNNCGLEFNLRAISSLGTGTWTTDSGPGSATFSPNPNSPSAKVAVNSYGTYVFRWTEVNGTCSNSAVVSVTFIQQPSANAGNGGDECDLNFILNAIPGTGIGTWTKVSGPGTAVFSPNANQSNATVTVSQFGSYDFAWTEVNSLCSNTDIVRVTFHDLPQVNAGTDVLLCKGKSIQLNASGSGSFLWTPASSLSNPYIHNPVAAPAANTAFTVTLTDQWGCKNSDQVNVEVRVQPVAYAGPDQDLDFIFETNLGATAPGTNQTGEWTLLSGDGKISDIHSPASRVIDLSVEKNSFIWTITNGVCPASSDTVNITVHALIVPTLITPNLDGNNDYFVIKGLETLGTSSLTVFNRWGGRVYENKKYDNSWDGVDENKNPLPDDTYFFILKPEKSKVIKSYVVIRR
jgi:gliding motility-associated-like protein